MNDTTTPPRNFRALDREYRATVVHSDGGYAVTDGLASVQCRDLDDARRRAWLHNYLNGFGPSVDELRDYQRQVVRR